MGIDCTEPMLAVFHGQDSFAPVINSRNRVTHIRVLNAQFLEAAVLSSSCICAAFYDVADHECSGKLFDVFTFPQAWLHPL